MRLNEIQQKLKAPKSQRNSFGGYNYRSCEDILEAVKPFLGDAILTLSDEMVEVANRVYVKATATLKDKDNEISVFAYAREAESKKGMDDSQITGAASSYARKYALNGLFLIDDTKDADATNNHGKDGLQIAKDDLGIDEEEQKASYSEYCEALKVYQYNNADFISFLDKARAVAKKNKWSTYQINYFEGLVEKKKKVML